MVDIKPFNGLYYNRNKVSSFSEVISPPYDVITTELKKTLDGLSPYNLRRLILPDGSITDKYSNASAILTKWISEKILLFDTEKCFYPLQLSFTSGSKRKTMLGFMGLTGIGPSSRDKILCHEKTHSLPKKDRLALLKECKVNFGPVYTLYGDREKKLKGILDSITSSKPMAGISAGYDSSIDFKLWRISDKKAIEKIVGIMKDKVLIIADGHHRYETSVNYWKGSNHSNTSPEEGTTSPEEYMLTLFMESSQEDIEIYPTYRMIKFEDYPGILKILSRIKDTFTIEKIDKFPDSNWLLEKLKKARSLGNTSFFIYGEDNYCLTLKPGLPETAKDSTSSGPLSTDVEILHKLLLKQVGKYYKIEEMSYSHSFERVKASVDKKESNIGIFYDPPSINDLENICYSGRLMPQKSTYFFPKPCSGLMMYKFDRPF